MGESGLCTSLQKHIGAATARQCRAMESSGTSSGLAISCVAFQVGD